MTKPMWVLNSCSQERAEQLVLKWNSEIENGTRKIPKSMGFHYVVGKPREGDLDQTMDGTPVAAVYLTQKSVPNNV